MNDGTLVFLTYVSVLSLGVALGINIGAVL